MQGFIVIFNRLLFCSKKPKIIVFYLTSGLILVHSNYWSGMKQYLVRKCGNMSSQKRHFGVTNNQQIFRENRPEVILMKNCKRNFGKKNFTPSWMFQEISEFLAFSSIQLLKFLLIRAITTLMHQKKERSKNLQNTQTSKLILLTIKLCSMLWFSLIWLLCDQRLGNSRATPKILFTWLRRT